MNKKMIIALGLTGIAAVGLILFGRYQREAFRKTIRQMRDDFLKYDEGLD